MIDVLFVNPDSSLDAYQELAKTYSAIEPPTWGLLLAQSCRAKGFACQILDCDAERLSLAESVRRIDEARARLVVFVIYGQNPNSGTTGLIEIARRHPAILRRSRGVTGRMSTARPINGRGLHRIRSMLGGPLQIPV